MPATIALTPSVVTPPPVAKLPAGPQPYRFTIAEYRQLGQTGLFRDKKTMLLDGEIYVMVFPLPPHDIALGLTDDWLRTVFVAGYSVRNQMGFDVGTRNDPGPDLAVVVGHRRDQTTTPRTAVLVIEVAEKSKAQLRIKAAAEAAESRGIPEWMEVDTKALKGKFKALPARTELPSTVNESLIIELYSK